MIFCPRKVELRPVQVHLPPSTGWMTAAQDICCLILICNLNLNIVYLSTGSLRKNVTFSFSSKPVIY